MRRTIKVTTTGGFFKKVCLISVLTLLTTTGYAAGKSKEDNLSKASKPNFVWLVSEDNSMHYHKLFFASGAKTPNIAKLAEHGLKFSHAFSNAAVCSSARSTLATGVLGPRIASHYHRNIEKTTLPKGWQLFQVFLKQAGTTPLIMPKPTTT